VTGNCVNLLPIRYRRRLEIRKLLMNWASSAILLIVACTMVTNWTKLKVANTAGKVADLQVAGEQVETLMVTNDGIQEQLRELQFLNAHLNALVPTDDLLQTLGALAMLKQTGAEHVPRVRALSMNLRRARLAQVDEPAEKIAEKIAGKATGKATGKTAENSNYQTRGNRQVRSGAEDSQLVLSLFGQDQAEIQQWMQAFAASPRVRRVQLGKSGIDARTGGYEAEIQAQIVVQKELP